MICPVCFHSMWRPAEWMNWWKCFACGYEIKIKHDLPKEASKT